MKLEDFTKAEIIMAVRAAGRSLWGMNVENRVTNICINERLGKITERREQATQYEIVLLEELQELEAPWIRAKIKDIPPRTLHRLRDIHEQLKQSQKEQRKIDQEEQKCFEALTALTRTS